MDARIYSGYVLCPEQECNTRNGFRLFTDEIRASRYKLLEN